MWRCRSDAGQMTEKLRPAFGVVRRIYTPDGGHQVRDIKQLVDGKDYVAAANDKFRPLPYRRIVSPNARQRNAHTVCMVLTRLRADGEFMRSSTSWTCCRLFAA